VAETRVIGGRVPQPLYDGARAALGLPANVKDSDLIRHAFARLAGLDVNQHTPQNGGRRPGAGRKPMRRENAM
jgi:hypothetical protein